MNEDNVMCYWCEKKHAYARYTANKEGQYYRVTCPSCGVAGPHEKEESKAIESYHTISEAMEKHRESNLRKLCEEIHRD